VSNLTRIFFASDIHGSEKCFRKFLNAGVFYKADVMILAGDITGKVIVPIVQKPDGTFSAQFLGRQMTAKSEQELIEIENTIRNSGFYTFRINPEELAELENNENKVDSLFKKIMVENVERWIRIAEETLKSTKVKCYISPGNDDAWEIDKALNSSDTIINPEERVVEIDGHHEMITIGATNHTPWNSPREFDERDLREKLERLISKINHKERAIFNIHCPPYGSGIDSAPKLDNTLKPVTIAGQTVMTPAGSTAVRDITLEHQPLVGLHGHIHESRGVAKLGRTKCFNVGSEYAIGILHGLILNISEKDVRSYLFTSG